MLTQEELNHLGAAWVQGLPILEATGEPFYTLMKFDGERNLGEVFAYPGVDLGFGVHLMTTSLFPTEAIARECEAVVRETSPEWRAVGISKAFLELFIQLVEHQEIKVSIALNPDDDSVVCATSRLQELAAEIREKGFSKDMLPADPTK